MWAELRDHLEVVYGASLALVIVDPAHAGRRRHGPAPRRGRRPRRAARPPDPDPAPRRPRDVLRDHRPLARLPRPDPAGARDPRRRRGRDRRRRDRRLPRPASGGRSSAARSLAASIPPIFGVWVDHFTFPFLGVYDLPVWVGVPLTVLWIVAVMNMVNFLDGLDGLAAGVCGIAGVHLRGDRAVARQADRGRVLGDRLRRHASASCATTSSRRGSSWATPGAMLLGFSLAAVSVEGLLKTAATVALFFPLLVLAVPILDTGFVVARRLKYRMPITAPDKAHLHHRFVNIGFSQRAGRLLHLLLGRDAGRRRARHALHPVPRGRPLARLADGRRDRARPARRRRVGLHGLPARDRQAREPAHPPPAPRGRGGGPPQRVDAQADRKFRTREARFPCHKVA